MTVVAYIKWCYCTYRPIVLAHSFVVLTFCLYLVVFFRTLILYDIIVEHSFFYLGGQSVSNSFF